MRGKRSTEITLCVFDVCARKRNANTYSVVFAKNEKKFIFFISTSSCDFYMVLDSVSHYETRIQAKGGVMSLHVVAL